MADIGLDLGLEKEPSSGKGLWGAGCIEGAFSRTGEERREANRGREPWGGGDLGLEPGTRRRGVCNVPRCRGRKGGHPHFPEGD